MVQTQTKAKATSVASVHNAYVTPAFKLYTTNSLIKHQMSVNDVCPISKNRH